MELFRRILPKMRLGTTVSAGSMSKVRINSNTLRLLNFWPKIRHPNT